MPELNMVHIVEDNTHFYYIVSDMNSKGLHLFSDCTVVRTGSIPNHTGGQEPRYTGKDEKPENLTR
jgi:hypothetical protein